MGNKGSAVHLHVHTDFSRLDGMQTVDEVANFAASDGQPAVAITDHDNLNGYIKLEAACHKLGIKPIPGVEVYHVPDFAKAKAAQNKKRNHMILLGETDEGYRNLMAIASKAYLDQYYYKPLTDDALLDAHSKGIIMTSGCIGSPIGQALKVGDEKKARALMGKYADMVGWDNYFVEVQAHDFPEQVKVNSHLIPLAKELGLPLLATQDAHYSSKMRAAMHEKMLAMQVKMPMSEKTIEQGGKRFAFASHTNYMATSEEMRRLFPEDLYPGAVDNTLLVGERSNVSKQAGAKYLIPTFPGSESEGGEQKMLRRIVLEGARRRYGDNYSDEVADRIDYELGVIHDMGFDGYFLIVWDLIRWAREQGIYVGPGRGSAAGSIVAYCTNITAIDPLKYGLYFERFLNPGRKSMPDIDIDFERDRRHEVRDYCRDKYGYDHVAYIATQGVFHGRSAIKSAARIHEIKPAVAQAVSSTFPQKTKLSIAQMMGDQDDLPRTGDRTKDDKVKEDWKGGADFRRALSKGGKELREVAETASGVEGYIQVFGKHAAGVLITPEPLINFVPLVKETKDGDDLSTCGYDKDDAEAIGGLKMDLLGLVNLTTIRRAVEQIEANTGKFIDVDELPLDDRKTFDLLRRADTEGVFQLSSSGMKELLRRVQPDNVKDLSAVLALYRPGPMGTNMHYDYADRKNGRQRVTVEHDDMLNFTSDTYGVMCVSGDTLVFDADSGRSVRIDSIKEAVEGGKFFTAAIDKRGVPVRRRVTNWYQSGVKEVFTVMTGDGRSVRLSADHPVLTINGWKKAGELRAGIDRLARPALPLPNVSGGAAVEEARLIGYLIGDGQITLDANKMTSGDQEALDDFVSCAQSLFPDIHPYYERRHGDGGKNCATVSLRMNPQGIGGGKGIRGRASHPINADFLPSMGYVQPTTSEYKHVPQRIFESSNEVISHFLAALWDCDGNIQASRSSSASLKTISRELAYGVSELLSRLGIHSTVLGGGSYQSVRSEEPRQAYGVHVHSAEFSQVASKMVTLKRRGGWGEGSSREQITRRASGESILNNPALADAIAHSGSISSWFSERIISGDRSPSWRTRSEHLQRIADGGSNTRLARAKDGSVRMNAAVQAFVDTFGDDSDVLNSNQHWVMIESISSDGYEPVYDITVEEDHNFLGNGFVLHNCFQEQMLALAQQMAGFTAGEADTLRKATGKKDAKLLATQEPKFKDGMVANGYSKSLADDLWQKLPSFAEYSFNAAHSQAYAMVSYQTAYLKANYTAEYAAACVDTLSVPALQMQWARGMGITFDSPDVNESNVGARAFEGRVRLGLGGIKGLGESSCQALIGERDRGGRFTSLSDFLKRAMDTKKLTKPAFVALIESGSLDSLCSSRGEMLDALPRLMDKVKSSQSKDVSDGWGDGGLFDDDFEEPEVILDFDESAPESLLLSERIRSQVQRLGVFLGRHPMSLFRSNLSGQIPAESTEVSPDLRLGDAVIHGIVTSVESKPTRRSVINTVMIESEEGYSIPVKIFGEAGEIAKSGVGSLLVVEGLLQEDEWRKESSGDDEELVEEEDAPREFLVNDWMVLPLSTLDLADAYDDPYDIRIVLEDDAAIDDVARAISGKLEPGMRSIIIENSEGDTRLPQTVSQSIEDIERLLSHIDDVFLERDE